MPRRTHAPALALAGLVLAAAVLARPAPAAAQVSAEADRQARGEFLAGRDAFTAGDFAAAVRRFERAYALSGRPQLLYNIGAAYDRLQQWEAARDAYHRFLEAVPDGAERAEVLGRLGAVDLAIERARRRAAAAETPRGASGPRTGAAPPDALPPAGEPPPRPPEPARPWRVAAAVTGGLAVLSGATSLTIGLLGNAYYDSLVGPGGCATAPPAFCAPATVQDVALRATLTNVFLGTAIGLGLVAAGAFAADLLSTRRGAEPRRTAALRVGVAPTTTRGDGATLLLVGTF